MKKSENAIESTIIGDILNEIDKSNEISLNLQKKIDFLGIGVWGNQDFYNNKTDVLSIKISKANESRISSLDNNIILLPEQFRILQLLLNSRSSNICVSAPTSFVKSLLIKEYIARSNFNNIAYIVPTNALASEISTSFEDHFGDEFDIYDSIMLDDETFRFAKMRKIFIGTQEKFSNVKNSTENFELVVIDEAYKLAVGLGDGSDRDIILSKILNDYYQVEDSNLILLTPLYDISDIDEFYFEEIRTSFSPVATKYQITNLKNIKELFIEKLQSCEKSIMYCQTKYDIQNYLEYVIKYLPINYENNKRLKKIIDFIELEFDSSWYVLEFLKRGILIHMGPLPKFLQNWIIDIFNDIESNVFCLIATKSISEGINTPTKNLFIYKDNNYLNNMLLKNTIGRAGRVKQYPVGHVFCTQQVYDKALSKVTLNLQISDIEFKEKVTEKDDTFKITKMSLDLNIDKDILERIVKSSFLTLNQTFRAIEIFTNNITFKSDLKLIDMITSEVFKNNIDNIEQYCQILLFENECTFRQKIDLLEIQYPHVKRSDLVDNLINFQYNRIQFNIIPLLTIFTILNANELVINNDMKESMLRISSNYDLLFFTRGRTHTRGTNQELVVEKMREYGVDTSLDNLTDTMLNEIVSHIEKDKITILDVKKSIIYLSESSVNHQKFRKLNEIYFSFR